MLVESERQPLAAGPSQCHGFLGLPNTEREGAEAPGNNLCDSWGHSVVADPVRSSGLPAARTANLLLRQCAHQTLRVKHGFVLEHEIDGPSQLDRDHGVGFELVATHFRFEPLSQWSDEMMIAFGNHGRLAKSPTQVRIAQLRTAQALDLARAGHRAFDQTTVGEEVFDAGEALDLADLVQDGEPEIFADAGDALEQGVLAAGAFLGEPLELFLEVSEETSLTRRCAPLKNYSTIDLAHAWDSGRQTKFSSTNTAARIAIEI